MKQHLIDADVIDGSLSVINNAGAGIGQSLNREASSAQLATLSTSAIINFTWVNPGTQPTAIRVKPVGGAVWVCFDAPTDAIGLLWCQGNSGEVADSQRFLVPEYFPEPTANEFTHGDRDFYFTSPISRMYILEYGTAITTTLIVEAA